MVAMPVCIVFPFDTLQGPVFAYFTVFAASYLPVHTTKVIKADDIYHRNLGTHLLKVTACRMSLMHLPYISSEQGGLIIHSELIYEYTLYKRPIPIQELRAEGGGGLIIHHGLIIRTIRYMQIKIPCDQPRPLIVCLQNCTSTYTYPRISSL